MGRARAVREGLDVVAVVLHAGPLAAHAQHALEAPDSFLVADGRLARYGGRVACGVAVLALGKPAARP